MKPVSYGTNVGSPEELSGMFNIYRTYNPVVPIDIVLSYLEFAGFQNMNIHNPHVMLTYYIDELDGYIAICNSHQNNEGTVIAVFLHQNGVSERFPKSDGDGKFSYINLIYLEEAFLLDEKKFLSDMTLNELQKTLNSGYKESEQYLINNC